MFSLHTFKTKFPIVLRAPSVPFPWQFVFQTAPHNIRGLHTQTNLSSSVNIVTRLRAGRTGFDSR